MAADFDAALAALPLVAILRGLRPDEAAAIGEALVEAGFRLIEVPLNSPEPFRSIETLAKRLAERAVVGAGTVTTAAEVARLADAGGRLLVSPHFDAEVVRAGKAAGLVAVPGVATPSEGFAALRAGADALKLFPAEALPPAVLKAWRAVFPPAVRLLPVGGIGPDSLAPYAAAGASGFGLGSALYRPGMGPRDVGASARRFVEAWRALEDS